MKGTKFPRRTLAAFLLASAALAAAAGSAAAQAASPRAMPNLDQEWRWVDFGPESGLPGGTPRHVLEVDSVVWVQTDEGAAWYDGFEWHGAEVQGGLLSGPATSLAPDSAGGVILVQSGRIFRGGTDGFSEVLLPSNLAGKARRAVAFAEGAILFSVSDPRDPGPFVLEAGLVRPAPGLPRLAQGSGLWLARSGRAWASTRSGLFVWDGDAWRSRDPHGTQGGDAAWVMEGTNGVGLAWRVTADGGRGVFRFDRTGGFTLQASEGDNILVAGDVAPDSLIVAVYETGDVRVWEGSAWRTVTLPPSRRGGVRMVHVTDRRDFWFGSPRGLHLFTTTRNRFTVNRRPFPSLTNRVNSILVTRDTMWWLGTGAGVLRHGRGRPGQWFERAAGFSLGAVTGLAQDSRGRVWVTSGGDFQGALVWDGEAWEHYSGPQGLDVGFVHRVFTEDDGTVWLASLGKGGGVDAGLYRWREGGEAVNVLAEGGHRDVRVYGWARDPEGTVWVASGRGIYRVTEAGVRLIPVGDTMADDRSRVWDVAIDPQGRPWFALSPHLAQGLITLRGDSLVHVVPPGPESVRRAWSLLFEDGGALWVGTEGGLLRYDDGVWARFDETTGLPAVNIWPLAQHPTSLLIGTRGGGLVSMSKAEAGRPPPRVTVRSQALDGRALRLSIGALAFWGEVPSDQVEVRTRIDGGSWGPWSTRRDFVIPNLSYGPHSVEVQGKGLFGQLSRPVMAAISVPFPVPLRPVFAVPIGVLLGALVVISSVALRRRRQDEEALRLSEGRLRALVEGSYEAIGILDLSRNRFVDANANALTLWGLTRDELLSRHLLALSPEVLPDGGSAASRFAALSLEALSGTPRLVEWTVTGPDGSPVPCELHLSRLPSASGALLRVSLLDVRERRAAETRRRELEEQLRQSQKLEAVGQLTGGVAHDFNNLLTVIHGNLEMLAEVTELDDEARGLVSEAVDATERSARLTQRLLAFSRRQTLAPTPLDLRTIVGELRDLLTRSLGEAVQVSFDVPATTWTVNVDRGQLESAILNLCLNSRDAMPLGGRIRIHAANVVEAELEPALREKLEAGDYVRLAVTDNGTGMPPEVQARAFDPFFTTKEVGKGTGLGLSMVFGFVTQSGGTVTLESSEGEGTSVILFLPRDASQAGEDEGREGHAAIPRGSGETILLVEDDPGVTRLLSQFLERLGYTSLATADGEAALRLVMEGAHIDAVLTDLVLPGGIPGVGVAEAVRELVPDLPVLYMSGYSEEALLDPVRPAAGSDILRKPFDLPTLARKLHAILAREG